jgi:hypothetical protein
MKADPFGGGDLQQLTGFPLANATLGGRARGRPRRRDFEADLASRGHGEQLRANVSRT